MKLETTAFNSLPVVVFFNASINQRVVCVFQTRDEAEAYAKRLRGQEHLTDVETLDAYCPETPELNMPPALH